MHYWTEPTRYFGRGSRTGGRWDEERWREEWPEKASVSGGGRQGKQADHEAMLGARRTVGHNNAVVAERR
ncbi:hypothetical protein BP5796_07862 [Coleophoma crateriformis]|uniref:Uncharacterized protein n=1 Tax=Coleophoma crateriformis TaxID=565419 RepID=A0A3D8RD28_9HELO|nr:hypothetical protein BP5796_07862 [Coleophoma crateriformis]